MCVCDTTIMQTWNVLLHSVLLCSSVVIDSPALGSVQKIFCGLGDIKLSEEQRWPSAALTSIAATVANLYQTFKASLARAGQAEDAPEPVLLRTESQLCVSLCLSAGAHPSSDRVSVVTRFTHLQFQILIWRWRQCRLLAQNCLSSPLHGQEGKVNLLCSVMHTSTCINT